MDEGIDVLVMHDDGTSNIERTSLSEYSENVKEINIYFDLNKLEDSAFRVEINFQGEERNIIEHQLKDKTEDELMEFCKLLITDAFLGAVIDSVSFIKSEESSSLLFDVNLSELLTRQNKFYFLNYDPIEFFNYNWLAKKDRKYPIMFSYPRILKKNITVNFNNRFKLETYPSRYKEDTKSISYNQYVRRTVPGQIAINKSLEFNKTYFPAKEYNSIRDIFNLIQKKDKEQLIFVE